MEYLFTTKPVKKPRLTIGFLDENGCNEYQSQLMAGVFEAAKKYDVNIIRFGYYASHIAYKHVAQKNMVLDHIEQYGIDGLLFLGWTKAASYNNYENFFKRFNSIPVLSLGMGFKNIPNVFFPGDEYIREIVLHLIQVHHFKRIAFVSPHSPDSRRDMYINTLKENSIFYPELVIYEDEVADLEIPLRARKALSILLDERKLQFDAIISTYTEEGRALIEELKLRNINVPDHVAVTAYEDGETGRFASPSLTTVYFPWKEVGFCGCEKMVELLTRGSVQISTSVPGKVVFRNSCGCMSNSVNIARAGSICGNSKTLNEISEQEKKDICREISKSFFPFKMDVEAVLEAFIKDYHHGTNMHFLSALGLQLRKISDSHDFSNIEDIASLFRKFMLPYFLGDKETLLWAEDMFQQAQVLTRERAACVKGHEDVQAKALYQTLQEISQVLITNFSIQNLMDSLKVNLPKINIPSCYIFVFNNTERGMNLFDDCTLVFEYSDNERKISKTNHRRPARQLLSEVLFPQNKSYNFLAHLLHITDEFIGFVLFELGPMDERIYQALSIHISTALRGAILLEKLDSSYKKLVEQAHREGMADIATGILHNVGNVLNSVNASIHMIKDVISNSPIEDFMKSNTLLEKNIGSIEEFICSNPKGKKLMQFYIKLGSPFLELKDQLNYHANRLDDKINLINDIIIAQQNYAGIKSVMEELDIVSIMEDALKMHFASLDKYGIKVIREYKGAPQALVQRTKLFHILVNLIKNAKEAMLDISEEKRELILTIWQEENSKYIQVTDTGCGIPPDSLESIFAYGYTTKQEGHGFGLHSCANYMTEMGGKLWAESDGPGKGAAFVLQLK